MNVGREMAKSSTQTTNGQKRVPVPFWQRFRHFRYGVMPFISFALCVLATAWLWQRQAQQPQTVGAVEAVRIDLAAGSDGRLTALAHPQWTLFDRVDANDVIARLDERPVQAQMDTLRAELQRLEKEVAAAEEQLALEQLDREHDHNREAHRLAWQIQRHRLDVLDRRALIEADRVELMRLEERFSYMNRLRGTTVVSELDLLDEQRQRDAIRKRIEENEKAWAEAEKQRTWAVERLQQFGALRTADEEKLLGPLEAAIAVQEARLKELHVQIDALQVRAPFSGTIAMIHAWPGQNVRMGDPIVTLAADHGRYIVSYVRQTQRQMPVVGTLVDVRAQSPGGKSVTAVVGRVGPQFELIPPHQRRDPNVLEWGVPVRIDLPQGLAVKPGELVDIRFKKGRAG
jgi:multidrug resistance efflux pump